MTNKPKVSIIIPVYKVEKFLDSSVESVVNQDYPNLEIILVDDGSPDKCPEICDKWAKRDNRIKVVHKVNGGVSDARNVGLDMATGDYVVFLDSDDKINSNFSVVCEKSSMTDADIIIVPLDSRNEAKEESILINTESFASLIKNHNVAIASSCSKLFKHDAIGNIRFTKGVTMAEDKEFVIKVLTRAKKVEIIKNHFYDYTDNPESVMNNKSFLIKKLFVSTKIIRENVQTYDVTDEIKEIILEEFSSNLYGAFRFYPYCSKEEKKEVRSLIKQDMKFLSLTKQKSKKLIYYFMKIFGIAIGLNVLNLLRKLKIVD